jgi:hypothetical protein
MALATELDNICRDIVELIQDELKRQNLVETGALLNSISCRLIPTNEGFTFQIEALDYFKYLDGEYSIMENIFRTSEYERIQERIGEAYSLYIIEQIELN